MKIKANEKTCTSCKHCVDNCPMDVDILNSEKSRKYGTECILCLRCLKECPNNSINL